MAVFYSRYKNYKLAGSPIGTIDFSGGKTPPAVGDGFYATTNDEVILWLRQHSAYGIDISETEFTVPETPDIISDREKVLDLINVISVKNFGAKGDGKNDDTDFIQASLDSAGEKNGFAVFIPAGTYMVSRTLYIPSRVTLFGAGPETSKLVLVDGADCDVLRNKEHTDTVYNAEHAWDNGIVIRDLSIDGNATKQVEGKKELGPYNTSSFIAGIRLGYCRNAIISNVWSYNCCGYGFEVKLSEYVVIEKCVSHDNGDDGFSVSDYGKNVPTGGITHHITIRDCESYNNGKAWHTYETKAGFEVDDGPYNVLIENCVSYGNIHGFDIHAHGAQPAPKFVTMRGCTFRDNTQHGIFLSSGEYHNIENCLVTGNKGQGIHTPENGAKYLTFRNLRVVDNDKFGIYLWTGHCIIDGCVVANNGKSDAIADWSRTGIGIGSTASEFTISNCQVFDSQATKTQKNGITVGATCTNGNLVGNRVYGNATTQVSIDPGAVTVTVIS